MGTESTDTSFLDGASDASPSVRLLIEETGRPPRVVTLLPGLEFRIGREDGLEITLDDARVSRAHAVVAWDGSHVSVRDLESSNGTWVGERRVSGSEAVGAGEIIRAGTTRIAVIQQGAAGRSNASFAAVTAQVAREGAIVAVDAASVGLFALVRKLAVSDLPVLLQGETGSGKEVVAQALHQGGPRGSRPFIAINCATLPESLAESELFGHERGSFTGATDRKMGVFEAAHTGTLLLDEVGELSATNQARLLRALQEKVIVRVGATKTTPVDVRVVGATNRDLLQAVSAGKFREDLYFRLNGVTISVPPLRSRVADVVPVVDRVIREHGGRHRVGAGVVARLEAYAWPGNYRELIHAIECGLALTDGDEIRLEHLPPLVRGDVPESNTADDLRARMDAVEKRAIGVALARADGNQSRAARELGISRRALIYKLERYGLKPPPQARGR